MIQNIKRRTHGNQWIDKAQRDPDHEGIVLLPERLTGFLPMGTSTDQRAEQETNDANEQGNQGDLEQRDEGTGLFISNEIRVLLLMRKRLNNQSGNE